jgi:ribosomal protein S18 acetylase RimI-like enzyme
MNMEIVTSTILDLNALRKLERACFEKDAWSLFDLIAVLSWPDVVRLKAVENGTLIGFIAGEKRPSQVAGWIATLAVDPAYQRQGIGRKLLRMCETHMGCPLVKLTVRVSNQGAISLYEQEGYRSGDIWARYYNDGEDGLVMEKIL